MGIAAERMDHPIGIKDGVFVGEVGGAMAKQFDDKVSLSGETPAGHDNCRSLPADDFGVDEDVGARRPGNLETDVHLWRQVGSAA